MPIKMFDKVLAAGRTVLFAVAGLAITALLGADWGSVLQPIADLGAFTIGGVSLDVGQAIATALGAGIVGALGVAASYFKPEATGYGYGVPGEPAGDVVDEVPLDPTDVPEGVASDARDPMNDTP